MPSHPEAMLLSAIVRTGDFSAAAHRGITRDLFSVHRPEWTWVERYHSRYGKCPPKTTFKAKFPEFRIKVCDDVDHYADEVRREHGRVRFSVAVERALDMVDNDDIDRALSSLHHDMIEIQSRIGGDSGDFDLVNDWAHAYHEVEKRYRAVEANGMAGIPTGFPTLDNLTGGIMPGEFWVVAARLGIGKTWTLTRMACTAFFAGSTVQYDSLEQSRTQMSMRCHTFISSVYGKKVFKALDLHKGKGFDLTAYKTFLTEMRKHFKARFVISDQSRGRVTPTTLAAQIERNRPDVLYLDYITLMDNSDDWRSSAKLPKEIKNIAEQYEVPIVGAAQINRTGTGKEPPRAEHLSITDAIGQDADCLVTMAQQSPSVLKMMLAKYRHGSAGDKWYCHFAPNTGKFDEISRDRAEELIEKDTLKAGD